MSIIQISGQPQQIWSQAEDTTLFNLDTVNDIWVGTTSSPDILLSPQGAFVLEGGLNYWVAVSDGTGQQGGYDTTGTVVAIALMTGLKGAITSPVDIAQALVGSTLAVDIADAIVASGIPITGNPILLYDVGGRGQPVTNSGLFGVTVFPDSSETDTSCIQNWSQNVATVQCAKRYFSVGEGIPTWNQMSPSKQRSFQALINTNCQVWVCYNPPNPPNHTTAAGNAMVASIQSLVAQGVPVRGAVFWQENWQFGNGPNLPPNATAASFKQGYQFYYPILHAAGILVAVDWGGQEPNQVANWDPGPGFYDVAAADYYFGNYAAGKRLDNFIALAHAANAPFGVFEMGNSSVAGSQGPPHSVVIQAINYITTVAEAELQNGHDIDAFMWYQLDSGTGPNPILSPTDYRVPALQALNVAVQAGSAAPGGGVGPISIGAGATVTLTPLKPSPNAGFAPAQGLSYDIELTLISSGSSTNPFVSVTLDWFNADDSTARRVGRETFWMVVGANGGTGTVITGKGPQLGQFLRVNVKNADTSAVLLSAQINSTARNVLTHQWYWDTSGSVNLATGINTMAGASYANSLGSLSSQSIPASGSKSWLMSLFQGEAWVRMHADAANVITATLQAQPTSAFGTGNMLSASLPAPPAEYDNIVILPRGPVLVTFSNSDAGSAHNISMQVNALEGP